MTAERTRTAAEPVFTPEMIPDPHPTYRRLRAEPGFYQDPDSGDLLVTRYADVAATLKHPRMSSRVVEEGIPIPPPMRRLMRPVLRMLSRGMLFSDPPDHTRMRSLATRAFTPRVVERMRGRIQEIADELLDAAERPGPVDLVGSFAAWLPVAVIAEMLGADVRDRERIKLWSGDLAAFVGGSTQPKALVLLRAARSVFCLRGYLRRIIRRRRRQRGEELIDALLAAEERGDTLSEEELLANSLLLLAAGHETTTHLIGNGLLALLRHPEEMDRLRREPALMETAVEELLRYDGPVQWTGRVPLEDVVIGGVPVPKGRMVAVGLAAGNRDPEQFPDPDRLDLARAENRHVAFGHGIHFCLGAALARLEGRIAIETVLRRYPDLRLPDAKIEWIGNYTLRGLKRLPVILR